MSGTNKRQKNSNEGAEGKNITTKKQALSQSFFAPVLNTAAKTTFCIRNLNPVAIAPRADALAAVKRYNNVQLDGKPMKIEIVGTNIPAPMVVPPLLNDNFRNFNPIPRSIYGLQGSKHSKRRRGLRTWSRQRTRLICFCC
ncbi:hypothetical protein KFK09_007039 [Dendrobium nobile]|uniref:RRM domain-containing protein n=1 Tax=Dendrobium nobile TaxID=94219 RepID=A0A8T3BR43_DENNO|nr:hypothetical protein KFK09_007039 [Dendrobium nobile]